MKKDIKKFIIDYVQVLQYKCHKINPNPGASNISSPDWIKNKKAILSIKKIINTFNTL